MLRRRMLIVCRVAGVHWYDADDTPRCGDAAHHHEQFEMHVHRESVVLPDGTVVVAVSFDSSAPYDREEPPAFGVYLDPRWQPPWPHELLDWPDFGVPNDLDAFRRQLANVLGRARQGETVEVGCLGGHGRTGTLLACLAIAAGVDPAEAVGWVRHNYCESAVETPLQRDFVSSFIDE